MKVCEERMGRIFVMRLEDGGIVPDCIERSARKKRVSVGQAILVGGYWWWQRCCRREASRGKTAGAHTAAH